MVLCGANHYTTKAFYLLVISKEGLGNQYYDGNVVSCWQQYMGTDSQELIATDEFGQTTSVTVTPVQCEVGVNYPFPGWNICAAYY